MTEEEFNKIKEAEKQRLRAEKRLQQLKRAAKRQGQAASLVRKMKQTGSSLLRDTGSLVDSLSSQIAKSQARLEIALDDAETGTDSGEADLDAYEAEQEAKQREARARELVRQMKDARGRTTGRKTSITKGAENASGSDASSKADASSEPKADERSTGESSTGGSDADDKLPEKTIGRMRKRSSE